MGWWSTFGILHALLVRTCLRMPLSTKFINMSFRKPRKTNVQPIPLVYPLIRYLRLEVHKQVTLNYALQFRGKQPGSPSPMLQFAEWLNVARVPREKGLITTKPPAQNSAAWLGKVLRGGVPYLTTSLHATRSIILPESQLSGVTRSISFPEIDFQRQAPECRWHR